MRKWGTAVLALGLGLAAAGDVSAQSLGGLPANSQVANTSNSPVTLGQVVPNNRFNVGSMLRRWRGVNTHAGPGRSYVPNTSSGWFGSFGLRTPKPYGQ